jgi:hypothetical protein
MRKPDPKSKDPKDESLVGETKEEEKEEVTKKNKEASEIGSNNNNSSMSKVNICKADDTSTVTVTSTSLETTKHQNSLEHKTPLLVINNSTQQPSTPDNNNASLNNYCSDKKNEKISSEKSEKKSGAGESLELQSSDAAADDSFNKTDLQEKIHEIPSANDGSILDRAPNIQTGAADDKNLDTISFTPVISSDDHDNQKFIKEKTATLDKNLVKTTGGAEVLVQSSQKLGKSATNLNDEDIIDSSALLVKISSSQLEKEGNTSATTDKFELDTLAANDQKDTGTKDTQATDSIVDRYLKDTIAVGKVPETEIETDTPAVKIDRSDKSQVKNVSAVNKPVKIETSEISPLNNPVKTETRAENQLVLAEIQDTNKPVKTETQAENQSVKAEIQNVNKPVKTETQAENQSVTAEVPAGSKPVKSSSFVFISKPIKTETEVKNQSGTADLPTHSLVKEAEGWVPWEPNPEIESVKNLVQKGLEVLIETTELNISSEDEVDSDDDFGDADPVQVIRSCIAACHLLHTTFSSFVYVL